MFLTILQQTVVLDGYVVSRAARRACVVRRLDHQDATREMEVCHACPLLEVAINVPGPKEIPDPKKHSGPKKIRKKHSGPKKVPDRKEGPVQIVGPGQSWLIMTPRFTCSLGDRHQWTKRAKRQGWYLFVTKLARQLAKKVDFLHEAGFIHTDIKPDNVGVLASSKFAVV